MFCCTGSWRIISGQLVGKIIMIPSFRVDTSKSKNTDHRVKETCADMSTQVTYETNYISLLHDSIMSSALIFVFYVFYCNLKEKDHIRRNTNIREKKEIYMKSLLVLF